jgi:hypothetical protein
LNPTKNERLKTIARVFIYLVLVVFLIRNVVDVYRQIAGSDEPVVQQTRTSTEVPDSAKSVAKLFLVKWYFLDPDEKDSARILSLQPFVTETLYEYINSNSDLRVADSQASLTQPNNSTQNTAQSSSTANSSNNAKFEGVSAKEVDVWQAIWKDQKANKVQIIARMQTSDDKTLFLSIPVEKSGSTWQVSSLPALIAEPVGAEKTEEPVEIDISSKREAIKTVLEDFFSDWLKGNKEAITRYMVDGKSIPTTEWEEKLEAEFVGVQEIKAESDNPLRVSVIISMKDKNNVEFQLNYHVTLQEKNGKLFIVSIN